MCGTMTAAQRLRCITLSVRLSSPLIRGRNLSYKKLYIYGSFFLVAPQPLMCIHKCIHNVFAVTAKLWSRSFLGYILGYVQGLLPSQLYAFPLLVKGVLFQN